MELEQEHRSMGGENEKLKKEIARLSEDGQAIMRMTTNGHDVVDDYVGYAGWRAEQLAL